MTWTGFRPLALAYLLFATCSTANAALECVATSVHAGLDQGIYLHNVTHQSIATIATELVLNVNSVVQHGEVYTRIAEAFSTFSIAANVRYGSRQDPYNVVADSIDTSVYPNKLVARSGRPSTSNGNIIRTEHDVRQTPRPDYIYSHLGYLHNGRTVMIDGDTSLYSSGEVDAIRYEVCGRYHLYDHSARYLGSLPQQCKQFPIRCIERQQVQFAIQSPPTLDFGAVGVNDNVPKQHITVANASGRTPLGPATIRLSSGSPSDTNGRILLGERPVKITAISNGVEYEIKPQETTVQALPATFQVEIIGTANAQPGPASAEITFNVNVP